MYTGFFNHLPSSIKLSRRQFSIVACKSWVLRHRHYITIQGRGLHLMRPELIKNCRNRVGRTWTWCLVLKKVNGVDSNRQTFLSSRMWVFFLVLHTLLLAPFCFVVLELFNVFSIFCMASFGNHNSIRNHQKQKTNEQN